MLVYGVLFMDWSEMNAGDEKPFAGVIDHGDTGLVLFEHADKCLRSVSGSITRPLQSGQRLPRRLRSTLREKSRARYLRVRHETVCTSQLRD